MRSADRIRADARTDRECADRLWVESLAGGRLRHSLLVAILATILTLPSAARCREWKSYTDVRGVRSITTAGDTVWSATSGGLLRRVSSDNNAETRFTTADGLGSNNLSFTANDSAGFLWTGGANGRLTRRIDDAHWDVFEFTDEDDLPIELTCATPGPDGFLWVGSGDGVHKFDTRRHGGELKESYLRIGDWADGSRVNDIDIAGGTIWLAGDAGIARAAVDDPFLLVRDHWQSWGEVGVVPALAVHGDTAYAGGIDGLLIYDEVDGGGSDSAWVPIGFAGLSVIDIHSDIDTLWVLTSSGPGLCDDGGCRFTPIPGATGSGYRGIGRATDGSVWVSQEGVGQWELRDGEWTLHASSGPLSNEFGDIAVDGDGRVWCVFPADGAALLDGDEWTEMPQYLVGASAPGQAIAISDDNDVWLTAFGSGAYNVNPSAPFDDTSWFRYDEMNSTLVGSVVDSGFVIVSDVAIDEEGRVWLANNDAIRGKAIAFYDHGCWGEFDATDGVFLPGLRSILATLGNSLLIGTEGDGLLELRFPEILCSDGQPLPTQGQVTIKTTTDGLPSNTITAILFDRFDSLWVGTNLGLAKWDPRFRQFIKVSLPGEAGLNINALAADESNAIWVGTSLGLVHLRPGETEEFYNTKNSGLSGDNVQAIAIDEGAGFVWIATTTGLSRTLGPPEIERSLGNVFAYPNPVEITAVDPPRVRFNAPVDSRVMIYTVDGRLVAETPAHIGWDCRTSAGGYVASGVYLYVIARDEKEFGRGKVAVINRR